MFGRLLVAATRVLATGLIVVPGLVPGFLASVSLTSTPATAGGVSRQRQALLVANAVYPDSDAALATPPGDLRLLAEELKRKGFAVETGENLDKAALQAAIDRFVRKVETGAVALVYFAGYGIQAGRRNYLVPVDARIWSEPDVQRDGIALDTVLADLDRRGAGARILILDAARRNPFERRFRSFSAGLAEPKPGPRTLELQSAAPGSVLVETRAATSPFATELVRQIAVPEASAEQALAATAEAVARASRNQQKPALIAGTTEPFGFDPAWVRPAAPMAKLEDRPAPAARPPEVQPKEGAAKEGSSKESPAKDKAAKPTATLQDKDIDAMVAAEEETAREFNAAMAKGTKGALEGFLKRHPSGPLAKTARAELARVEGTARPPREAEKPVAVAPPPPPAPAPAAEPAPSVPSPPVPWRSPPKTYSMAELQRKASLDARITRNPRDATAFYERGQFHAQRDDYPAAIADFDQAIRLEPSSPEALNNRCWVRAINNDLRKALSDCNDALKLKPGFVDALDSRGFVNLKADALQAAIQDYDAALRLAPTHSSSLYGRGIARSRLGQSAQANDDLTRALALNPMIDKDFAQYGLR
ncbi:caspase family protein [Methylobacterium sp. Leaf466]|uniref:caspase family protein n=1 Tax=Methylobacterium sp. Leaf466 TaxID=1736386 RepID=UPI0009EC3A78|nr:caspase family protein [Methylobacterium sp. Leaf466]